jgi:hypothetical protein
MENNDYLRYSKYLIIFIIALEAIRLFYVIVSAISANAINNAFFIWLAKYFPFVSNFSQVALNLIILFLIIYLAKRTEGKKRLLDWSRYLMTFVVIISLIAAILSILFGTGILGTGNTGLVTAVTYFFYVIKLEPLAFNIAILLALVYLIQGPVAKIIKAVTAPTAKAGKKE